MEEQDRYQALALIGGDWFDVLGESLTAEEMGIALPDLLNKHDNIKIEKL